MPVKNYGNEMVIYAIAYFSILIFLFLYFFREQPKSPLVNKWGQGLTDTRKATKYLWLVLAAGFVLRILLANWVEGFPNDIACFKGWAMAAANNLPGFYTSDMFCDYPPLYIYVLSIIGKINALNIPLLNFTLLVKLPAIIADIAIAYIIYSVSRRRQDVFDHTQSLIIAAVFVFNPASIVDSTIWGMMDSFFTLFVILAMVYIMKDRLDVAAILMSCAVLMKPQGIFFVPVLIYALIRKKDVRTWALSAIYSLMTLIAVILPFSRGQDPLWIVRLYLKTAGSYGYASFNAFNLFALFGANLKPDSDILLFLTYGNWGLLFIAALVAFSAIIYFRRAGDTSGGASGNTSGGASGNTSGSTKAGAVEGRIGVLTANPVFTAILLNTGIFVLATKMHERYMFPVIALALLAYVYSGDKKAGIIYAVSSLTIFANIHTVLHSMLNTGIPHIAADNTILTVVSYLNVFLLAYIVKVAITDSAPKPLHQMTKRK